MLICVCSVYNKIRLRSFGSVQMKIGCQTYIQNWGSRLHIQGQTYNFPIKLLILCAEDSDWCYSEETQTCSWPAGKESRSDHVVTIIQFYFFMLFHPFSCCIWINKAITFKLVFNVVTIRPSPPLEVVWLILSQFILSASWVHLHMYFYVDKHYLNAM